jgi:hypothetical protein
MKRSTVSIKAGSKETLTTVYNSTLSRGSSESPARYGLKWGLILLKKDGFLTTKALSRICRAAADANCHTGLEGIEILSQFLSARKSLWIWMGIVEEN